MRDCMLGHQLASTLEGLADADRDGGVAATFPAAVSSSCSCATAETRSRSETTPRLARQFIERGTAAGLDTRCASRYRPPPFVRR
jgi:hypothetical protein